ncbi:MAG: NUDIX hydrolase [Gammaproteobacteria bacterium]|nr:NUDIX hydrolase [Gammaproteobacteria bacterium]
MPVPQTPLLAADVIIELDGTDRGIVLIERKYPPPGWALPGGFVDIGETVEQAAVREALEETSLHVTLCCLLGCYSDPRRDPRGHTVSLVFIAAAAGKPCARDDARSIKVVDPAAIAETLAFDHARIVDDYLRYRASGRSPAWFPREAQSG